MANLIDLTGATFGEWTVLERAPNSRTPNGTPVTRWMCRCSCGTVKPVAALSLRHGGSTRCGACAGNGFVDLAGQTFGQWSVLEQAPSIRNPRGTTVIMWRCRHACGAIQTVRAATLVNSGGRHPRCLRCPKPPHPSFIDLAGMTFGKWTVLTRAPNRRRPGGIATVMWECRCACGTLQLVPTERLRQGLSKSCQHCAGNAFIDLTGRVFGKLTVIERAPTSPEGSKGTWWVCRCACGTQTKANSPTLRRGDMTRCRDCARARKRQPRT